MQVKTKMVHRKWKLLFVAVVVIILIFLCNIQEEHKLISVSEVVEKKSVSASNATKAPLVKKEKKKNSVVVNETLEDLWSNVTNTPLTKKDKKENSVLVNETLEDPWGPSPTWPIWNHPKDMPLTIFQCGWLGFKDIAFELFPEYTREENLSRAKEKPNSTEFDLAIYGKGGPCPQRIKVWLAYEFKGKKIYFNGEKEDPKKDIRSNNSYAIGPLADSSRSIRSYWGVWILWRRPNFFDNMFNHSMKKKNTNERFLIYANGRCVDFRDMAFNNLSQISIVDYGGKCKGVTNSTVNKRPAIKEPKTDGWGSNMYLFNHYRFCLVMENAYHEGYITEKIIMAFLGGCIPIYYGTTEIFDLFNKDSFIYYDIHNPIPALLRIAHLELNQSAYEEVLAQPILSQGQKTIEEYFSYRDDLGGGKLKYRIRKMLGLTSENATETRAKDNNGEK